MEKNVVGLKRFALLIVLLLLLQACGGHVNHRVQKGDTLYSIGWHYKQDYRDIARWNNLRRPYVLHKGQWLRVAPPVTEWWEEEYPDRRRRLPTPIASAPNPRPTNVKIPNSTKKVTSDNRLGTSQKKSNSSAANMPEWHWPIRGRVKINTAKEKGIDIYGKQGQPVYAAAEGRVVYSGDGLVGYGNLIIVKHGAVFLSAYAHNQDILVKEGDSVLVGQQIASMGNTGTDRVSLYFEIRENGEPVDPLLYLKTPK